MSADAEAFAPHTPQELAQQLDDNDYLADEGVATACFLALRMGRPLFLEGDAGVGKTELAKALAHVLGGSLIRLQCHEGIDATQALYDWDYPRQLLHLRAAQAAGVNEVAELESGLYTRRFLLERPLLRALGTETPPAAPPVLLIDEIDRADDEFEAFLLEFLADFQISIPEFGTVRAATPPVVVLTSNRTREVHDALKRRCLYHWMPHPDFAREVAIIRRRRPEVTDQLARDVARASQRLREPQHVDAELLRPPGVAESIDWAQALDALGVRGLDPEDTAAIDAATRSLGALVKQREDHETVRGRLRALLNGASAETDTTATRQGRL
ncbi:MoxR family ATPase [Lipingzhangella sp. LS1_29]|uniref:MoxR family ATPase n=1 Tax=Lipingzhangella rawalii TaxID=2055835 RepID=A0ABU2H2C3_9ACTN|nr:MoxR family ATPase [Lipingzhangella rawalii]MDS1269446.1 MoxR family ATPase [Lipingzhangella rawalii]